MEVSKDRELGERLAQLEPPDYDPGFFADLWLRIAEDGRSSSQPTGELTARAGRRWFGVPRWTVATSLLAALAAICVVAVSVPGVATALHLPLGSRVSTLQTQNLHLREALIGQLTKQLTTTAHVVAVDGGTALATRTPAERLLARHPDIERLVRDYFATQVLAHTPGPRGTRGRQALVRFFPNGSAALARARYLALGTRGEQAVGRDGQEAVDPLRGSVAVVRSLELNPSLTRATVVVWPAVEYQVWIGASGRPQWGSLGGQSGEPWGVAPSPAPHRLRLVRSAGQWLISDDFSLDSQIPTQMRRGGAPEAVWRGEQRLITREAHRLFDVPSGVKATFEHLVALLNARRFRRTATLFADGVGLPSSWFQHPNGSWRLRLMSVHGYNPLSLRAVADPGETSVVVRISAPKDLLTVGGGIDFRLWTLRRADPGRWLITGGGAPESGAP